MFVRFKPFVAPYWGVTPEQRFHVEHTSLSGSSVQIIIDGVRTGVPIGALIEERRPLDDKNPPENKPSDLSSVFDLQQSAGPRMGKAMVLVREYVENQFHRSDPVPEFEVFVVWFNKTLQNWKALVSTTLSDGMYYEVTHNGDKHETYIDVYKKFNSVEIPD